MNNFEKSRDKYELSTNGLFWRFSLP